NHCVPAGVGVFHIDDDENGRAFTTFCAVAAVPSPGFGRFTKTVPAVMHDDNVNIAVAAHPRITASFTRRDGRSARARPCVSCIARYPSGGSTQNSRSPGPPCATT